MMSESQPTEGDFYVATDGSDVNPGTEEKPFATLARARDAVRESKKDKLGSITVLVRGGTYYMNEPLLLGPEDSGTAGESVTYAAYPGELVTISGGRRLDCEWKPYKDGIVICELPEVKRGDLDFAQLFVNGKRQIRARYPNYDDSDPKNFTGYILAAGRLGNDAPDPNPGPNDDMTFSSGAPRGVVFDPHTFTKKHWAKPDETVIHIYQAYYWGNLQWRVKHIDWQKHIIWFGHGGQQMGAKWTHSPCEVNEHSHFYIENVFEELDVPREWYLNREEGILYYMPEDGMGLETAVVEVPALQQVVRFVGTQDEPICHVTLKGFRIAHTASTFLEPYEIPSLGDWAIHRGGAIFLEGARDCTIKGCFFDAVGGNAVFMNRYNRDNVVTGCRFTGSGDSAICFVGELESTVGTQRSFPYECEAVNNLIHDCGAFGKQIAGVYISRAKRIRAAHNKIYRMPRAGICIGDGTWGGHVIEYNHIHDTCRETGDHGPFNAWGRDKYWCLVQSHTEYTANRSHFAGHVKVDAMEPVILRYNLFEETSGWGLDLDDGASNYEIYNNLCVGVSMKLREGAYRTIYNNIWVNGANSPCFHVGNEDNHDRYFRNITVMSIANQKPENDLNFGMGAAYGEIYTLIAPPARGAWLEEIDYNCFYSDLGEFVARVQPRGEGEGWRYSLVEGKKYSLEEWRELGFDLHSVFADPMFVDPENGDYRVRPESPALELGFENFDISSAGLTPNFPKHAFAQTRPDPSPAHSASTGQTPGSSDQTGSARESHRPDKITAEPAR
jgi:hypothetical protein